MQVTASVLGCSCVVCWPRASLGPTCSPRRPALVQRTLHDTAAAIFIYRICTLPVEIFAQICRYLHLPAPLAPCSPCHTLHEGDIYIALEIFALFALVCRNICNSCISSLDPLNPCPVCNVTRVHVRSAGAGLQVAGAAGGG